MSEPNELPRGAVLSLRECAAATNVSYSTIKRRQSEFTHAYRDHSGIWRVPVTDLLAAGLKLRASSPEPVSQAHEPPLNAAELAQARAEIQELTAKLADERERRLVAETEARLLAANLDDVRFSLRAISGPAGVLESVQTPAPVPTTTSAPAAPGPVEAAVAPPVVPPVPAGKPRRGLWARIWAS